MPAAISAKWPDVLTDETVVMLERPQNKTVGMALVGSVFSQMFAAVESIVNKMATFT